jgi:hypothetical protein
VRLWSLHPKYLDGRGLVALWREALLAQAVLRGRTRGYVRHPQLHRFRAQASPRGAIAAYLRVVCAEAASRGYAFADWRIGRAQRVDRLVVTDDQLMHEWRHLLAKLAVRNPELRRQLELVTRPQAHPLFRVVAGGVEPWEKGSALPG